MSISQNEYDELFDVLIGENEDEKRRRLNRLRAWAIKQRLDEIDDKKVRPMSAEVAGTANDEDRDVFARLEAEAIQLRAELAELEVHNG